MTISTSTRSFMLQYGVGLLAIASVLLLLWPGLASNLFASTFENKLLIPHGSSFLWIPSLVALHASGDLLIFIACTAISITLFYMVYRAHDIPFRWIFLAIGLFIILCGTTHFLEMWSLWNAKYWFSGYVKLVTGIASMATAVVLPTVVPKALLLVNEAKLSRGQKDRLESVNNELQKEIIERKQAEEQLSQATQTLHAIFRAAPLAIYAVDPVGRVSMWNPAAERIFGWSEIEAIGQQLPLIQSEKLIQFDDICERVMLGQSFADMELRRQKRDGSEIDISISTAPLRDRDGDIVGCSA